MSTKNFSVKPFQIKVEKPWGYELILTMPDSPVTGKILHVNEGHRSSLQYHDVKEEILTLIRGEALLILENEDEDMEEVKMEAHKGYLISPFQKHRYSGISDCDIFEVSTPEKGNTVRLEDDYDRGTETEEDRNKRLVSKHSD